MVVILAAAISRRRLSNDDFLNSIRSFIPNIHFQSEIDIDWQAIVWKQLINVLWHNLSFRKISLPEPYCYETSLT